MHKRVNVTLPEETIRLIDRAAERGDRSRFIDAAVRYFVRQRGRTELRRLLEEGAERRAARDLAIAEEWLPVARDAWRRRRRRVRWTPWWRKQSARDGHALSCSTERSESDGTSSGFGQKLRLPPTETLLKTLRAF